MDAVNCLGSFCGKRDVPALTKAALKAQYGFEQADVMVLFGGSILCGGDVLAQAMQAGAAKKFLIVGGEGHTTQTLRQKVQEACPEIKTQGLAEAAVFAAYLKTKYGLTPDFLECASTNCGNNITYLLALLQAQGLPFRSIILTQDATMQRRMEAGLRKEAPADVTVISYAAYAAHAVAAPDGFAFEKPIAGMWDPARYLSLLLGEIPRLTDDAAGYGPRGKGFIAHVEIPPEVQRAFATLRQSYGALVRQADPRYASRGEA